MIKIKIFLITLFTSAIGFSQSVNDYKAVIVPIEFSIAKGVNPYRLSTNLKANLVKAGFTAFYQNDQIPSEYGERCDLLYADLKKDSGFLVTKLAVEFKDCYGKVIYTSEIGRSKEKEYPVAYKEALDLAFLSIYDLHYKYNGTKAVLPQKVNATTSTAVATGVTSVVVAAPVADVSDPNLLYAQPTDTGYQLIDKTPKVVMKLMKTSRPDSFIAIKDGVQGTLNAKDNQWFFEYYKDDKLVSEKVVVKF